jgi:hypothetical protein
MKRSWRSFLLHPFLFAIYPVMAMFAYNMGQSRLSDAMRALVVLPGLAFVVWIILSGLIKSKGKAGALTSLIFLLVFSYGHFINRLSSSRFSPLLENVPWLVAVLYILVFGIGLYLIITRLPDSEEVTFGFNLISIILLVIPLITIITFFFSNRAPSQVEFLPASEEPPQAIDPVEALPDIYYIIPDGYARSDVLTDLYDLDNSEFLTFLESRGFYIAAGSHSNYDQTALSVASSMNFDYLDAYAAMLGEDSQNREILYHAIDHSRLRQALEMAGYTIVDVNSGSPITQIKDAHYYLTPSRSMWINFFEREILAGSVFKSVVDNDLTEQYRARMLNQFELSSDLEWIPSPKFVFIHFLIPHPPFVFDRAGNPVTPVELVMRDGSRFPGGREGYLAGYREQLPFVNAKLMTLIDEILARSQQPPVIILQSDHGPGAYLDWSSADKSCIVERTSILNAYLLPGVDSRQLYAEITPVNTFRLVLNAYLGTDYELLPDRVFMPTWEQPYRFIEVTDLDDTCTVGLD